MSILTQHGRRVGAGINEFGKMLREISKFGLMGQEQGREERFRKALESKAMKEGWMPMEGAGGIIQPETQPVEQGHQFQTGEQPIEGLGSSQLMNLWKMSQGDSSGKKYTGQDKVKDEVRLLIATYQRMMAEPNAGTRRYLKRDAARLKKKLHDVYGIGVKPEEIIKSIKPKKRKTSKQILEEKMGL